MECIRYFKTDGKKLISCLIANNKKNIYKIMALTNMKSMYTFKFINTIILNGKNFGFNF